MPYQVVERFEAALCEYTGAKYAVTVNSCSAAIMLAVAWAVHKCPHPALLPMIKVPKRTYCSVPMSIKHGGACFAGFVDRDWRGSYALEFMKHGYEGTARGLTIARPPDIFDSARRFTGGMYRAGQFQCVSFQTSKILGIEQGGAILHDNAEADTWLRRARFDGRLNADEKLPQMIGWHCYMNPSTAALGLARLACLPRDNPDQAGAADFADISELECFR